MVPQAPEKGKANKAIIDLLARSWSFAKAKIELLSGEACRRRSFWFARSMQSSSRNRLRQC